MEKINERPSGLFYIVDVRPQWRKDPYITVWRPDNAGYAWPLSWAGKYDQARLEEDPSYYYNRRYGCKRALNRFPVPCAIVDRYAEPPEPGRIDGDAGPVLPNTKCLRSLMLRNRYDPAKAIEARKGGDEGSVHESAVACDLPKGE